MRVGRTYSNGRGERIRGITFQLIFTIVPAAAGLVVEVGKSLAREVSNAPKCLMIRSMSSSWSTAVVQLRQKVAFRHHHPRPVASVLARIVRIAQIMAAAR